jgi:HSP20 family protein
MEDVMANIVKRNEGGQNLAARDPWRQLGETMRDWMGWDPFRSMAPLAGRAFRETFEPGFDVRETPEAYVIEGDVPGVKASDLEVTLTGNSLQIQGKREAESEQKEATYYCSERFYGSFTRAFTLPEGIDTEHATSSFDNGVLKVTIPKRPESQPRRIAVGPAPKTKA